MGKIKLKKGDAVLLLCLLLAAAAGYWLNGQVMSGSGDRVVIRQQGKTIATYPLNQDTAVTLTEEWGTNTIRIRSGKVYMESADCRDQYCVKHRPISSGSDAIICLPHKLVVEVETGGKQEEVDSIAN